MMHQCMLWLLFTQWILARTDCDWLQIVYQKMGGNVRRIPRDCCRMFGVRCRDGHVVKILWSEEGFTGFIPSEVGNLADLEDLQVINNRQLSGQIPKEIGNLLKLKRLILERNQLTGEIPGEIGNLVKLKVLSLSQNRLTGIIPQQIEKLVKLNILSIAQNQLTGEIPKDIGNMVNLEWLMLKENQLNGSIPKEIGNLSNLRELHLHKNLVTGEIPLEIGNLARIRYMNNSLSGSIPNILGRLDQLEFLDLSNNQLTGPFPTWAHGLPSLRLLNLGQNDISGEIPLVIGERRNDGGFALTNIREFISLLCEPNAIFRYPKRSRRSFLNFIRSLRKYHPYNNKLTKYLLWIDLGRSSWGSIDLKEIIDDYIKAEETHSLTYIFQRILMDPVNLIEILDSASTRSK